MASGSPRSKYKSKSTVSRKSPMHNDDDNNGDGPLWNYLWDIPPRLQKLKIKEGQFSRHLILIRHADHIETDGIVELSEQGLKQAKKTAQRLIELEVPISKIISSTMPRAKLTAELIKKNIEKSGIEMVATPLLNEGAPVLPNPEINNWSPNAKDLDKDSFRLEKAFREFFHRASPTQQGSSCDALVCHANVIRYLVCRVMQFPADSWLRMTVPHCSLTAISIDPSGKVWLRGFGEYGHLDASEGSY